MLTRKEITKKYRERHREEINKKAREQRFMNHEFVLKKEKKKRSTLEYKKYHRMWERKIRLKRKTVCCIHYNKNNECCCDRCGFSDIRVLTIHHINGGGRKQGSQTTDRFYMWLIKNNFPSGFQTLCFNCQYIKRDENNECHRIIDQAKI
jgi:hypothetical protein